MLSRAALAASVVLGLAVSVHGQRVNPRAPAMRPAVPVMPIQLRGTVAGVGPGMVALTTSAGETWRLTITPKAEVRVTGTAEPDVLRPGIYVRFIAPVDKRRGLVQGQVDKLIVFSPSRETGRMPGVFYAGQEGDEAALQPKAGQPPGAQAARNPAVPANPRRAGNAGGPAKPAPGGRRPKAGDQAAANIETFDVRGRLTSVKGRWLTVSPPRNTFFRRALRIELAEKPEVKLDVTDYTLAKSGDKIAAQGVQIAPNTMQAMKVLIQLTEPLVKPGKKPRRPPVKRPGRGAPKGDNGRQPFEVADEVDPNKPREGKQTPPRQKPEKPQPQDKRSKQILEFLQAKPEEIKGKPGVTVNFAQGGSIAFTPCKQLPAKQVLGRFGLPDRVQTITGSLPVGEGGQRKEVKWQLYVYGSVMFFVDEADTTCYLTVRVDQKKQQQEKKQQPEKQEQEEKKQEKKQEEKQEKPKQP